MLSPFKKSHIDDFILQSLGLERGEIAFRDLWNHFVDRGDFYSIDIFDSAPLYIWEKNTKRKVFPDGVPHLSWPSNFMMDLFLDDKDLPAPFKKKLDNKYRITNVRHYDDDFRSMVIVYGNRTKKNGEWTKNQFKLVEYVLDTVPI
jgi:hypothetical protein